MMYSSIPSGAAVRVFGDSLSTHLMRWNVIFKLGNLDLMLSRAVGGGGKAQTIRRWSPSSEDGSLIATSPMIAVGLIAGIWEVSEVPLSCEENCDKRRDDVG